MITQKKIDELRQRMLNHEVRNDQAVVVLTAAELEELLDAAEMLRSFDRLISDWY